jgi:hypothetical protein
MPVSGHSTVYIVVRIHTCTVPPAYSTQKIGSVLKIRAPTISLNPGRAAFYNRAGFPRDIIPCVADEYLVFRLSKGQIILAVAS